MAHEVKLRVYENKQGLRGTLLDSNGHNISSTMFYEKDRDNTIYRVKEYFGLQKTVHFVHYKTLIDYGI